MIVTRRIVFRALVLVLVSSGLLAGARAADAPAAGGAAPAATSGADRFFLAFAEEAAVAQQQWWEGDLVFTNDSPFDTTQLRLVAAFQPIQHLEVGGRVGFGHTDGSSGFDGGSGATDLDAWGKYHFPGVETNTDLAAGGLVTIPTGDDTAGLGHDAFDIEAFGSLRHRTTHWIIGAQTGLRINGDQKVGGVSTPAKNSWFLGGGFIRPLSDAFSIVGEVHLETERLENGDSDARVLGGVDWRPFAKGTLRGSVAWGLTDGAPNLEILFGYAQTF